MATASVTYTFTGGGNAVASEVNTDFTDIVNFLNNDVLHVDGSKPMGAALTLVNADPVNDNDAARKKYVDDRTKGVLSKQLYTADSLHVGSASANLFVGDVLPSFTMPTLGNGRALLVEVRAPWWQTSGTTVGDLFDVGLRNAAGTLTYNQSRAVIGSSIGGEYRETIDVQAWFFDNTQIAAGATAAFRLYGALAGSGSAWLRAGTQTPIVAVARLI